MVRSTALIVTLVATLAACEQRDPLYCGMHMDDPRCSFGDGGLPEGYFVIGGTVKNLNGGGLVLQNNGSDDKAISSSGAFTFSMPVMQGSPYAVTVSTQPTNPSEMCTVANGSGTATADVSNVEVTCMPAAYTVGGTVAGFTAGGNIVLTNNGVDDKTITSGGAFTFLTPIQSGHPYDVEIKSQSGETCSAVANVGTVGSGPVTTVVVVCGTNNFTVGGTPPQGGVTGLNGSVRLHNGGDTITVNANGAFAFPTPIQGGGTNTYAVTVTQQPAYPPAAQNCVVANGTGTVGTANITNVQVACTTKSFTVGGTISGLIGTVVLKNGADMTSVTTSPFTMNTPVLSGTTYSISVATQPAGESCVVTSGGSGTMANANVTNVAISCVPVGIKCGSGPNCTAGSQVCCDPGGTPSCSTSQQCNTVEFRCDDSSDCGLGGVCCVQRHQGNNAIELSKCAMNNCSSVANPVQLCDPTKNQCPNGTTCQPYFGPYSACL